MVLNSAPPDKSLPDTTLQIDPVVLITLRGTEYKLEFNNFAVIGIFRDTGINLLTTGIKRSDFDNPSTLGSLLFRGLQTNHPQITVDEVNKAFTYRQLGHVIGKVLEAIKLFMPEPSEKDGKEGGPEAQDPTQPPTQTG